MDKRSLGAYLAAKKILEDTEKALEGLHARGTQAEHDVVRGSMQEHPYTMRSYQVEGTFSLSPEGARQERHLEKLLEERKKDTQEKRDELEATVNRMVLMNPHAALIVKYRYMDGLTWEQTAKKLKGGATKESVRKELNRFLKNINNNANNA